MLPHHHILKDRYTWTVLIALMAMHLAIEYRGNRIGNISVGVFVTSMVLFGLRLAAPGRIIRNDYQGRTWIIPEDHGFGEDPIPMSTIKNPIKVDGLRTDRMNGYAYKLAAGTGAWIDDKGEAHTLGLISGVINHLAGGKVNENWAQRESDKSWEKLINGS